MKFVWAKIDAVVRGAILGLMVVLWLWITYTSNDGNPSWALQAFSGVTLTVFIAIQRWVQTKATAEEHLNRVLERIAGHEIKAS